MKYLGIWIKKGGKNKNKRFIQVNHSLHYTIDNK